MTLRRTFFVLHQYLGLLAALPLILAGLSGAILVFEEELDRAMNPTYWSVRPQEHALAWQDLISAAGRQRPGDRVTFLRVPAAPDLAAELSFQSGVSAGVDPFTGRILGVRRRGDSLMSRVHQFHVRLLMGAVGGWITGISAAILLLLGVSGSILWWRRKGFAIDWSAPWRRVNYDAHHALGIYFLLPWMILGFTGVAIGFEKWTQSAAYFLTRSAPVKPPPLHSTPTFGATPISVDAALATARKAIPGANPTAVSIPTPVSIRTKGADKTVPRQPPGVFMIFMKYPEDHTPAGRSRVVIDQFSGSPIWKISSRTAPAGTRVLNLNRPIHTGDIFGWPTRILACAASALLAFQVVSGIWMWWPRKKRKIVVAERAAFS